MQQIDLLQGWARMRGAQIEIRNDYVDATAFGDMNRTYLAGVPTYIVSAPDLNQGDLEAISDLLDGVDFHGIAHVQANDRIEFRPRY
jgi:hypothetical protein